MRGPGFIRRYLVHAEWHLGYRPRVSVRRAPRSGDIVWNGLAPSVLERCEKCGDGFLARELTPSWDPPPAPPMRIEGS